MDRIWTTLLMVIIAAASIAEENLYICDASTTLELSEAGTLENSDFAKAISMHQARFAVDRKSGIVAGGPFATVDAKDGRILSSGSDKEALKIVWLAEGPFTHLKYLWVRSYANGPKKPFLGVTGNVIITGTCE
jgi:hypothetical protein